MLKIRFQRTGRKNDPAYRLVVGEHTKHPKSGKQVQIVGSYHPKTKETTLNTEAIKGWLEKGAQASGTVHNLLVSKGIIDGKKVNVLPRKKPVVKDPDGTKGSDEPTSDGTGEDNGSEAPLEAGDESPADSNGEKAEAPAEEGADAPTEETPAETPTEETTGEVEEQKTEEAPVEEEKKEG